PRAAYSAARGRKARPLRHEGHAIAGRDRRKPKYCSSASTATAAACATTKSLPGRLGLAQPSSRTRMLSIAHNALHATIAQTAGRGGCSRLPRNATSAANGSRLAPAWRSSDSGRPRSGASEAAPSSISIPVAALVAASTSNTLFRKRGESRMVMADSLVDVDGSTPHSRVATPGGSIGDRKSTRLNSSHVKISYAVFCLKKKTTTKKT